MLKAQLHKATELVRATWTRYAFAEDHTMESGRFHSVTGRTFDIVYPSTGRNLRLRAACPSRCSHGKKSGMVLPYSKA